MPDIQDIKKQARLRALQAGLSLERDGDKIESVDLKGNRQLLAESTDTKQLWTQALRKITDLTDEKDVNKSTFTPRKEKTISIFTDGGSRGNPGPSASGFVIYDEDENILEEGGEYLGITTNNQAEYQALRMALEKALAYQPLITHVFMDSELIIKQINGLYKVKNKDLVAINIAVKELIEQFPEIHFSHVPREKNTAADAVVNRILDLEN